MGTIGFLPKVDKKELDELLELDKRIKNLKFSNVKKLEDLSPGKAARIKELQKKKAVVISSRVHPGETVGSWMMKGVIDFLTDVDN
jgi:hypothetical protein